MMYGLVVVAPATPVINSYCYCHWSIDDNLLYKQIGAD